MGSKNSCFTGSEKSGRLGATPILFNHIATDQTKQRLYTIEPSIQGKAKGRS
jgi:hypothetical protein